MCSSVAGWVAGVRPHRTHLKLSRRITTKRRRKEGSRGPLPSRGCELITERASDSVSLTVRVKARIASTQPPNRRTYGLCVYLENGESISRFRGWRPSFIQTSRRLSNNSSIGMCCSEPAANPAAVTAVFHFPKRFLITVVEYRPSDE